MKVLFLDNTQKSSRFGIKNNITDIHEKKGHSIRYRRANRT